MHSKIPDYPTHRIAALERRTQAFTITELLVATAILVVAVTVSLAGYVHMLREMHASDTQVQLDVDIQTSVERIKRDVRLSSLDRMFFFPAGPGPYTAMSFPMARDDDGDGVVDKDDDDEIIWDRTVVYHVWNAAPHQLRRTVFDPRQMDLTDGERQEQLNAVALVGSGEGTLNGANATTQIIFENLFVWDLSPHGAIYDAYAPSLTRATSVCLGSCLLDPGPHTVSFTTIGKHPDSTGYHIGIDSLVVSPSGSPREGEDLHPPYSQLGALADRQHMPGGSWSGNYQLLFPATAEEQHVTVEIDNDLIKETNFDSPGDQLNRLEVVFDETEDPHDFVLSLLGNETNWAAAAQTGTGGTSAWVVAGAAIRVVLRGEDMAGGNWINFDGDSCRIRFDVAHGSHATISGAYIGRCAGTSSNLMDVVPGTQQPVLFSGNSSVTLDGGAQIWSDTVPVSIERTNSYAVSYLINAVPASAAVRRWDDAVNQGQPGSFLIPGDSAPGVGELAAPTWSGLTNMISADGVLGVAAMHTGFPATGNYISAVFDTHCDAPAYSEINWDADVPSGTSIELKVRTGMKSDLSDALDWPDQPAIPRFGVIDIGSGRYAQFHAELQTDSARTQTPRLRDVTVRWHGPQRVVDVAGTFTKGPSYGIFEVRVDDQEILTGVAMNMEIFRDIRGHMGTKRVRSRIAAEINPRNTGL